MAKIDLYDPKWVDMVFAGKNKEYGAYQLRKGTSGRNIKSLLILVIAAALVGGFLAWKVIEQKQAEAVGVAAGQICKSKSPDIHNVDIQKLRKRLKEVGQLI